MRFDFVSLFPEMIDGAIRHGVVGRAVDRGIVEYGIWNPRDYTEDRHRTVDDRPYGGGPGMVMKVEPLRKAIAAARSAVGGPAKVIYLSPQGRLLHQDRVVCWAGVQRLILVCGRYEGLDERLIALDINEEWSIGDYVLSGGELAALVVFDAVTRLLPGVLGDEQSTVMESHMHGRLDHPHYTRPDDVGGLRVPEILASGNHAAIARWRRKQSVGRTWLRRPDLLAAYPLAADERALLDEFQREIESSEKEDKSCR